MSTTITLSRETKKLLDELRKDKPWDEFLREIALKLREERRREALKKLRETARNRDISLEKSRLKLSLKG